MEDYNKTRNESEYEKNKHAVEADMKYANEHQKRSKGIKTCLIVFLILFVIAGIVAVGVFYFVSGNIKKIKFTGDRIKGSGNVIEETRDVQDFTKIEVQGGLAVDVKCGEETKIKVEADDNVLPYIETNVDGNKLTIKYSRSVSLTKDIKIEVSAKNIDELTAGGASKINMQGFKNESLKADANGASKMKLQGETGDLSIKATGASNIVLEDIKAEKIDVELTGASDLKATGTSENINIKGTGASSIEMEDLKAQGAMLDLSGASNAKIDVEETLKVKATGASNVRYRGSPGDVRSDLSGASKLEKE